ncbi:Uncharacterized conserved protein, DUF427 family [Thiohalospira halophila DSM 15071]|uniref:Uncharacterized conserved protein, DUF427 family n=1 Tax=Thiohalospira halophila DSM 15071 TaxID=1123397 RepID=A0A1I1VE44_9GAMM|nr:DUF427 domain-containing protein [Thiohalospira halophila]SFD81361.1 Uncharacterized conserved protein, DUF427 family [Thiohalospira halophila DSM 15071]
MTDDNPFQIHPEARRITVGSGLAVSDHALRVEQPPVMPAWYLPAGEVDGRFLIATNHCSYIQWVGETCWFDLVDGTSNAAWLHPDPSPLLAALGDRIAFDPHRVTIYLDGEPALASTRFMSPASRGIGPIPAPR